MLVSSKYKQDPHPKKDRQQMSKLKIKLIILGQLPVHLDKIKLTKWKSEIFEIVGQIDNYTITNNADGLSWEFTDNNIESQLPNSFEGDFLIAMTHVPLEHMTCCHLI